MIILLFISRYGCRPFQLLLPAAQKVLGTGQSFSGLGQHPRVKQCSCVLEKESEINNTPPLLSNAPSSFSSFVPTQIQMGLMEV